MNNCKYNDFNDNRRPIIRPIFCITNPTNPTGPTGIPTPGPTGPTGPTHTVKSVN